MIKTHKNIKSIEAISNWILNSGIQSKEGGFHAWFDLDKKEFSFLYSEITGYGITALLFLNKLFGKAIFIENAKKAADWIINCAMHSTGGIKAKLYKDNLTGDPAYSFKEENIYSFDTGMVLYGIVNLYKITKENKYIDASMKIADFLIHRVQDKEGWFLPIYNGKTGSTEESFDKWSNQHGSFHAKITLGLVCLYKITKNEVYRQSVEKICRNALLMQAKSGRFITNSKDNTTHLHPHCYSIEGLLYTGVSLNIPEFIEASQKAVKWMFEQVHKNGLNEIYSPSTKDFNDLQRADILAQAMRLGLILNYKEKIEGLKNTLLSYQYLGAESGQCGGFFYTKGSRHTNSWCTMFSLQALAIDNNDSLASESRSIDLLI